MKPSLILWAGLLLVFSCNGEKHKTRLVPATSNELSLRNDTLFYRNTKFTGAVYELDTEGDTLAVSSFLDGLQDGISTKWYSNRRLMEIRSYTQGRKSGKQIAYFENGGKKFEFVAQDDRYEGELKEWNAEGNLIHLATYRNGQEEGTQKMWYDNGKIRANYVMKNGRRYGLLGTKNCKNVSDSVFVAQ